MTVQHNSLWRAARRALASIRVRIVFGYVVLLSVALAVAVIITRQVQLSRAEREIEQEQVQEIDELRRLAGGRDPATGELFAGDVEAIFDTFLARNVPSDDEGFYALVDGMPYESSNGSPPLFADDELVSSWRVTEATTERTRSEAEGAGQVWWLAVPLVGQQGVDGVFVVASFPDDDHAEVAQVVRVIIIAGLAVLIVTSALAWSLAGRVMRPVRQLTSTARQVTESDLSARIPVVGHDELAELGRTFNAMVERLDDGFRSQRRFLDDVAHELRTPITIALGHLEVIGDDPAERAETLDIVADELGRMSRYVSDLLLLAKSEQPEFLRLRPVDLAELANDSLARIQAMAPRRWVLDAAPPVGMVATFADPDRLGQAVVNLAANAVQHTDADDEIGVGVHVDGRFAALWVRDTGHGVDPTVADTLFDRSARGATSRSTRPEGTGIGLSIVDAIARAHGGQVSFSSRVGEGATFTVTIPLTTAPRGAGRDL